MAKKTGAEARAERITWFMLVMIFIVLSFDISVQIPGYFIPFTVGTILFGSGFYQYRRGWRVSPVTWMVAATMFVIGGLNWYLGLAIIDPILASLIGTVLVIFMGIITNEG